ncbi:flocculation protein FLO11-like [Cucumis melo var. makuwa]|uniref:Flocculation protein FLO11-like n=1 Tax=Cucumis melo var. makuwa TaxID=1194695 RepID=A0A5D3CC70_CUCMM|nr:flocculation protein FLO11-like [Cucumis melo var. makuwa]TYK07909.1 flocculation protein FLO11-like [Cucumis melo var. makuwa]
MDTAAAKSTTSSKGKRYKGIPTKHLYKKVRKSIPSGENSAVPSPEHSSNTERSENPPSPVTVKEEVLEFSSPQSALPSVSLSIPKSSSRPEPRVSVETVILDSDSSNSEDNVVLSTLLHRTRSVRSNQTASPAKPRASGGVSPKVASPRSSEHTKYSGAPSSQASPRTTPPSITDDDDDDFDDKDYAPGRKEKTKVEATSTSTENQSASHEKDPSDHRSTEQPGESLIPRSTEGPSEFSTPMSPPAHVASSSGFRRPPTKGQRERAHKWKYVVKRRIADEANIADWYNSCPAILELIRNDGLIRTVSEVDLFYPRLMRELIENLPLDFNDPSADEYQKVHIRGVCFNVSLELLNSYLGLTLPADYMVSYPTPERLAEELTGGTIPSTILTPLDTVGSAPRVIPLSMCLFQGAHIPDVAVEFDNAPGGTSTPAALQPAVGHPLTLSVSLANRLLQTLIAESRALTRKISELTDRHTVLDAAIRGLRHAASGTTPPPSD